MQTEQKYLSDPAKAETDMSASAENSMCRTAVRTAETAARGGDVIFEVDEGLNTLSGFPSHRRKYCCQRRRSRAARDAATEKMVKISLLKYRKEL